jgi:hypothetical protein
MTILVFGDIFGTDLKTIQIGLRLAYLVEPRLELSTIVLNGLFFQSYDP